MLHVHQQSDATCFKQVLVTAHIARPVIRCRHAPRANRHARVRLFLSDKESEKQSHAVLSAHKECRYAAGVTGVACATRYGSVTSQASACAASVCASRFMRYRGE